MSEHICERVWVEGGEERVTIYVREFGWRGKRRECACERERAGLTGIDTRHGEEGVQGEFGDLCSERLRQPPRRVNHLLGKCDQ